MSSEKPRRKTDEVRKDTNLRMRVSEAHLTVFKAAAERAGISLSSWVTDRLLRAARQEQKE
jgi:predicted HicB family RNase H-like nuclease